MNRGKEYQLAWNIIDAEYDVLRGFTTDDLWDYLSIYPELKGLTREASDQLFKDVAGKGRYL